MKKNLLAVTVCILVISVSAFVDNNSTKKRPLAQKFFQYIDYPDEEYINDPTHYQLPASPVDCGHRTYRCGVFANL
jgi:hypothetical protein